MKKLAMGIDIGGTNTAFGLVDEDGTIFSESAISTEKYKKFDDYEAYIKALCESMHALIGSVSFDFELIGIGIGAPNANYHTGMIEAPANLWKFRDDEPNPDESRRMFHFVDDIKASFPGVDVAITNDANAAALGEMNYGVARGMKNFIMLTLGTGVGSGIVINGQMVYGCDGFAGELGHVIMRRDNGRSCGCGRTGCLEAYCSATGVARTAREFLSTSDMPSLLREYKPEDITSLEVSIAAGKGDELAKKVYDFTGEMLGEACADFAAFASPEAFVFFGGLTKAGDLIMEPIKKSYDEHVMPVFKGKAQFLISGLDGSSAAVLGASAIGWDIQE